MKRKKRSTGRAGERARSVLGEREGIFPLVALASSVSSFLSLTCGRGRFFFKVGDWSSSHLEVDKMRRQDVVAKERSLRLLY